MKTASGFRCGAAEGLLAVSMAGGQQFPAPALRLVVDEPVLADAESREVGFQQGRRSIKSEILAGYRFGHGMVRPSYRSNDAMPNRPIFHPRGAIDWMTDWRGHRKLPVQW